ncbi:MAG: uroporphyrinogen-III synthase [Pseudomonadota bacterium]
MATILTTRPTDENSLLTSELLAEGFHIKELPLLTVEPLTPTAQWFGIQQDVARFDFIIVVSPRAAHIGAEFLAQTSWPTSIEFWTPGNKTCAILKKFGIVAHTPSAASNAQAIADCLKPRCKNKRILIWKGVGGRPVLREQLAAQASEFMEWNLYERKPTHYSIHDLAKTFDSAIDAAIITSAAALENYLKIASDAQINLQKTVVLVPSKRIAVLAEQHGIKTYITNGASNAAFVQGAKTIYRS